jgi:hypothetical protein
MTEPTYASDTLKNQLERLMAAHPDCKIDGDPAPATADRHLAKMEACAPGVSNHMAWADPITPTHYYKHYRGRDAQYDGVVLYPTYHQTSPIFAVIVTWPAT